MNFSSSKQVVKPPQRGIFPLDHDSECRPPMQEYVACLDERDATHHKCRELSRAYLQCRMENQLMAKENLDGLGFSKDAAVGYASEAKPDIKESEGFLAGKHIKKKRNWFWQ